MTDLLYYIYTALGQDVDDNLHKGNLNDMLNVKLRFVSYLFTEEMNELFAFLAFCNCIVLHVAVWVHRV